MQDKVEEIYSGLVQRCKAIKDGRFIMCNNNIAKLLRYIASYSETTEYLAECNRLQDYKQEFHNATTMISATKIFKMPDKYYKVIVLVTGLLYDIDRGKIDILAFIKEYFNVGDLEAGFDAFCAEVIMPYAKAYENMTLNRPIFLDDDNLDSDKDLSKSVCEQLLPYMVNLSAMVVEDKNISSSKRGELLDMLEGMCYAIEKGGARLISYMWIGVKNTFASYRIANSVISGIRSVLVTFGIIRQ